MKTLIAFLLAVCICVSALPTWAAPAWVQGVEFAEGADPTTTQPVTWASNTTTGNTILCGTASSVNNLVGISDSQGNTYTLLTQTIIGTIRVQQAYAINIIGGTTPTVTADWGATGARGMHCAEFSGLVGGLDQQAGQAQTDPGIAANAVTSGNITTTQADEVIFTTTCCSAPTVILGTNYTYIDAAPAYDQGSAYRIVSSTGVYAGTWTANGATDDFATRVSSFRATSGCRGALTMMGVGGC